MSISKAWDWSKNEEKYWLIPCMESAYLAENWKSKGFAKFLDLGCGLGRHSVYMAHKGFDTTAVDLSNYGINYLEEWALKEKVSIKTAVCDMLELPFKDNSFDCIMAYNVIYHTNTEGFIKALEEIRRVLMPNGEIFLTLISKNTWSFQKASQYKKVDENTILRDEHETEKGVPHFYVNINDIKCLFKNWKIVGLPKEWCDYNLENSDYYSKHWTLIIKK
jgi:ubiquinone/menaquinone biosynthesis C-methylase UbiE